MIRPVRAVHVKAPNNNAFQVKHSAQQMSNRHNNTIHDAHIIPFDSTRKEHANGFSPCHFRIQYKQSDITLNL